MGVVGAVCATEEATDGRMVPYNATGKRGTTIPYWDTDEKWKIFVFLHFWPKNYK